VEDLDREVLAPFSEDLHLLLLQHLAGAVVGIDDVISELELDELDFTRDLELLRERCFFGCLCGNGVLLRYERPVGSALESSL
jgi:hypothetical protein